MSHSIIIDGLSYELPVPVSATKVSMYQIGDHGLCGSRYFFEGGWNQIILDEYEIDQSIAILYQGPEVDAPKTYRDLLKSYYSKTPRQVLYKGSVFVKTDVSRAAVSSESDVPTEIGESEYRNEQQRHLRAQAASTLRRIWDDLNDNDPEHKRAGNVTISDMRSVASDDEIDNIAKASLNPNLALNTWDQLKELLDSGNPGQPSLLEDVFMVLISGYHCLSF